MSKPIEGDPHGAFAMYGQALVSATPAAAHFWHGWWSTAILATYRTSGRSSFDDYRQQQFYAYAGSRPFRRGSRAIAFHLGCLTAFNFRVAAESI
jgi:hypothetical protein